VRVIRAHGWRRDRLGPRDRGDHQRRGEHIPARPSIDRLADQRAAFAAS
jgi:hypothetical protein